MSGIHNNKGKLIQHERHYYGTRCQKIGKRQAYYKQSE